MPDEPEKTPPAEKRSWLMPILGGVATLLLAIAGVALWQNRDDDSPTPDVSPTPTEPTNCTFINPRRPKVDDKFILLCAQGQFTATGTYTVDHFVWSDFKEYHEPK